MQNMFSNMQRGFLHVLQQILVTTGYDALLSDITDHPKLFPTGEKQSAKNSNKILALFLFQCQPSIL